MYRLAIALVLAALPAANAADAPLRYKTLVVWAAPANLTQRGGSALTIDDGHGHFDGIVFAELAAKRWMAGSDYFKRSNQEQDKWPEETTDAKTTVQIAIVYKGKQVTIYRNGQLYADYKNTEAPFNFGPQSIVVFGPRHLEQGDAGMFAGTIEDARIYARALTKDEIAGLKPREATKGLDPWAWWKFDDAEAKDSTGRFTASKLIGGAKIENGRLVLDGRTSVMLAGRKTTDIRKAVAAAASADTAPSGTVSAADIAAARRVRHQFLADPYRPAYHFVIPEGFAFPFDPNCAIYWKGRYHLFYIYQENRVHVFGHVSSIDLLHWREHPPALFPTPDSPEKGIFSGNAFVNLKGEATMLYHGVGAGNCIATATDANLEKWHKLPGNPIIPIPKDKNAPYAAWDPDGWVEGDTYYAISGGKHPAVFKAKELDKWTYVGDFLHHAPPGIGKDEDISCADFFKLGNKRVLVCISHRLGARYYIGDWKDEQFHPDFQERFSWVDNAYFAPESLEGPKGRRIMWAWIFDQRNPKKREASGWSGEMSLPRELLMGADGKLRMRPIEELKRLRYNEESVADIKLEPGKEVMLDKIAGNTIELQLEIELNGAKQCGVRVCRSPEAEEQTAIFYDAAAKKLKIDTTKSGEGPKKVEAGPFTLQDKETLTLRVFVDKSVVEAYANDRQGAMRRIYPTRSDSLGVSLFAEGGPARVKKITAWQMMPTNPY